MKSGLLTMAAEVYSSARGGPDDLMSVHIPRDLSPRIYAAPVGSVRMVWTRLQDHHSACWHADYNISSGINA